MKSLGFILGFLFLFSYQDGDMVKGIPEDLDKEIILLSKKQLIEVDPDSYDKDPDQKKLIDTSFEKCKEEMKAYPFPYAIVDATLTVKDSATIYHRYYYEEKNKPACRYLFGLLHKRTSLSSTSSGDFTTDICNVIILDNKTGKLYQLPKIKCSPYGYHKGIKSAVKEIKKKYGK